MHSKAWLALGLFCLGFALLTSQRSEAQTKGRAWEYKTLVRERYIDTRNMTEFSDWSTTVGEQAQSNPKLSLDTYLNQLGAAGWELVSAAPMEVQRDNITNNRMYYVFKRLK
jgi:hypothetical protein